MQIEIGRVSDSKFTARDIEAMHELRFEVFRERLKWEVPCIDRREVDDYDSLDPTYMLVKDDTGAVTGCWRMLPTTSPYMMKDTFPQTLGGQQAPEADNIWELSRFSDIAIAMMERAVEHALAQGVVAFVSVTTTAIERMMKGMGLTMQRYAPPVQIGIEKTVAFRLELNQEVLVTLRRRRIGQAPAATTQNRWIETAAVVVAEAPAVTEATPQAIFEAA